MEIIYCVECGSEDTQIVGDGVVKCFLCNAYFDLEELPTKVEKIKHKQHEEEEDSGI